VDLTNKLCLSPFLTEKSFKEFVCHEVMLYLTSQNLKFWLRDQETKRGNEGKSVVSFPSYVSAQELPVGRTLASVLVIDPDRWTKKYRKVLNHPS
jgi:hypothetical protein